MRLALVTGKQGGNQLKGRLEGIKDNLNIDVYDNITEYIDLSYKKNIIYDRILVLSNMFNQKTLSDLNKFWNMTSRDTNIVAVGRKGHDERVAEVFQNMFQSPITAFMLVESTSVKMFAEAVLSKPSDLNSKYGIPLKEVTTEEDSVEINIPGMQQEEPEPVQEEKKPEPQVQPKQEDTKKKKKGLFGGLFGKKENQEVKKQAPTPQQTMANILPDFPDEQPQQVQNNANQVDNFATESTENYSQTGYNESEQNSSDFENQQLNSSSQSVDDEFDSTPSFEQNIGQTTMLKQPDTAEQMLVTPIEQDIAEVTGGAQMHQTFDDIPMSVDSDDDYDYTEPEQQSSQVDEDSGSDMTVQEDNFSTGMAVQDDGFDFSMGTESEPEYQQPVEESVPQRPVQQQSVEQPRPQRPVQQQPVEQPRPQMRTPEMKPQRPKPQVQEVATDDDFSFGVDDFSQPQQNTQSRVPAVTSVDDIDLGADTVTATEPQLLPTRTKNQSQVREVSDDLGGLSAGDAEQAYRQQQEAPKVIIKEVVKEVKVATGHGTINALKSVYAGKTHKVIIVTGDRATGITTTAINIAQEMAKSVPILYFDCDIDNHGLLSYINYDTFRDYENVHMQGVKLAKNAKSFNTCVCRYADNFDMLTTDYSCEVTNEELEDAGATVSEVVGDYGVVIVDCPVDRLHLISDLVMIGNTVLCVEGSKRGFMNMLSRLESSPLSTRYKRAIVSKGTMFITKVAKGQNMKQLKEYINDIFIPTGADWMSMKATAFNGKINESLLNAILE